MSLPHLLWSELYIGFTRYEAKEESKGLNQFLWAPGRSHLLLRSPAIPEIKLHLDREIFHTKVDVNTR
jgi:hypothetical protein